VPVVGPVLFDASPVVYMMLLATPLAWYALRYTRLGRRIRAAGENPKALDTAGVSVSRVRYAGVLVSGVLAGIGGAGFTVGQLGTFVAVGQTSIGGRGFLGIVAYLFGNYNPLAAVGGAALFAGFDSLQLRLQQIGALDVPSELFGALPFVVVLLTLALVKQTRIPAALGEYYDDEK
jgi:simple sugar transport system permease protein